MERLSDAAIDIINDLHTERLDYTSEYLPLIDALNCLAEYENAEAEGRLVVLPCKIGDTVWAIRNFKGNKHPQLGVVSEMYFRKDMTLQIVVKYIGRGEFGKIIFRTLEEAEQALKGESE